SPSAPHVARDAAASKRRRFLALTPCRSAPYTRWVERRPLVVDTVIPARDAAATLTDVLQALPFKRLRSLVVVDNGSPEPHATARPRRRRGGAARPPGRRGRGSIARAAPPTAGPPGPARGRLRARRRRLRRGRAAPPARPTRGRRRRAGDRRPRAPAPGRRQ